MGIRRVWYMGASAPLLLVLAAPVAVASSVTVVQKDFAFSPSTVTMTSDSTLVVVNSTATTPHTFTAPGHGIDVQTAAGQTGSIAIDLPPGTHPFICRFHVKMGMKGTLVVLAATSSSSAGAPPLPSGGPQTGEGGTARRPFPIASVALGGLLLVVRTLGVVRRVAADRR